MRTLPGLDQFEKMAAILVGFCVDVQFFQVSFFSLAKRGFGIDVMPSASTSGTRRWLKVLHGLENGLSACKKTLLVREIFSVRSGDSWRIWKSLFFHALTLKP